MGQRRRRTPRDGTPHTVHEIYHYGWLGDGSSPAYAPDRVGRASAATAWHQWVASTLPRHEHRVEEAPDAVRTETVYGAVRRGGTSIRHVHKELSPSSVSRIRDELYRPGGYGAIRRHLLRR